MESSEIKVIKLNLFPIKSCHGLSVEELRVGSYGVEDDRRFMLVDGNKRFVSQRKFSKLATIQSRFVSNERGERMMHVSAPGMERELQFAPVSVGERIEASIWEDRVMVVDQGDVPAQWFGEFIGHGGTYIRLVASAESSSTITSGEGNTELFHRIVTKLPSGLREKLPAMQLALADDGPVSLVSHESLADLNVHLRDRGCEDVPLNRFRMNIEISGCSKPFEEDDWLVIQIGEVPFLAYTNAEVGGMFLFCDLIN